jgi:hypothetical protein
MYRDVNLNLRPKGSQFVFEVQLTLTGISILKKSEQKIYTLARMASAEELLGTFVFSKDHEVVVPIALAISDPLAAAAEPAENAPENPAKRNHRGEADTRRPSNSTYASPRSSKRSLTSAEDVLLDVKSRNPAVGEAQVLSMDVEDEQERVENVSEDVHAVVGRLQKRNHILSNLSCVCCADEQHAGSQASARPDLEPIV